MIVEDETIVARDIETQLTKMGFSVVAIAATGEEALSLVVEQQPDLVLMDIKLRGAMDGIETAREILSKSDIPFIYITAHADKETLQRAKLTAPYTYVIKPIDSRDLYNNIDIALYRHSLDKSLRESEARYRLILRTAMDGFIVIDEQDRLLDVNDAFCVICGYNRA